MIVQSFGALQALTPPPSRLGASSPGGSLRLYDHQHAYEYIYATQPNVRICVDFLARNIAHVAPHVFRRVSDTDRVRLADHQLAQWLNRPNPATTRYRLIESLIGDLGIYFNAYWVKVRYRGEDGRFALGFVRLPPGRTRVEGGLLPSAIVYTDEQGRERTFPLSEIVYFNGYNPCNPLMGLSPLETLRRILAEEEAAGDHREHYWRNSSKQEGVIERAVDSPSARWKPEQKAQYREQLDERYTQSAVGSVAILEPGMTFKAASWSAKDSEYVAGGKLRREVCAAAYHIPQPFVGILEHATFSNIREQHKNLYQDTLGPWFEMLEQELERQVLPEADDQDAVYLEFNIAAKLAGTPEEQIGALVQATGKPVMKVNEARARLNLPRDEAPASDEIAPQQGGPATATTPPTSASPARGPGSPAVDDTSDALVAPVVQAARRRQVARLAKVPAADRPSEFFARIERWNRELAADLAPIVGADIARRVAADANLATFLQLEAAEEAA